VDRLWPWSPAARVGGQLAAQRWDDRQSHSLARPGDQYRLWDHAGRIGGGRYRRLAGVHAARGERPGPDSPRSGRPAHRCLLCLSRRVARHPASGCLPRLPAETGRSVEALTPFKKTFPRETGTSGVAPDWCQWRYWRAVASPKGRSATGDLLIGGEIYQAFEAALLQLHAAFCRLQAQPCECRMPKMSVCAWTMRG